MKNIMFILFMLTISNHARACSCAEKRPTVEERLLRSTNQLIALATVVLVEPQGNIANTEISHFEILEHFKGPVLNSFQTRISTRCCTCGYKFIEGETYLVFARKSPTVSYHISICSGTKHLHEANKELEYLRKAKVNQLLNPAPKNGTG